VLHHKQRVALPRSRPLDDWPSSASAAMAEPTVVAVGLLLAATMVCVEVRTEVRAEVGAGVAVAVAAAAVAAAVVGVLLPVQ